MTSTAETVFANIRQRQQEKKLNRMTATLNRLVNRHDVPDRCIRHWLDEDRPWALVERSNDGEPRMTFHTSPTQAADHHLSQEPGVWDVLELVDLDTRQIFEVGRSRAITWDDAGTLPARTVKRTYTATFVYEGEDRGEVHDDVSVALDDLPVLAGDEPYGVLRLQRFVPLP